MSNYPTLRFGVLQGLAALKECCDAEEGYLRKAECPYDNDTVALIEKMFKPQLVEVIKEVVVEKPERGKVGRPSGKRELNDDDAVELETEAKGMLAELHQLGKTSEGESKELDTQTKLSILKARTSLMEKLVSIRERFTSSRKVIEFQNTIVGILDDLVVEDMRPEFLKRLEPFR